MSQSSNDSADDATVTLSQYVARIESLAGGDRRIERELRGRSRSRERIVRSGVRSGGSSPSSSPERLRVREPPPRVVELPAVPVDTGNGKFRHYCFTWNNYPVNAAELLTAVGATYLCYQPERGTAGGTRHLQGK